MRKNSAWLPLSAIASCVMLFSSCQKSFVAESEKPAPYSTAVVSSDVVNYGEVIGNMELPWDQQFDGVSCRDINTQYLRGNRSQIPVREGNYAVRMTVRPGDVEPGTSGGERCEMNHYKDIQHGYTQEVPGNDFVYGFSMYMPTNWVTPPGWCIVAQWHHRSASLPPIAIHMAGNTMGIQFYTGLLKQMPSTWYANYTVSQGYTFLNNPAKGVWHDFMIRIKFSPNYDGLVEIWHKLQWEKSFRGVFTKKNFPTMQLYTQAQWPSLDSDNHPRAPDNRLPWGNYVTTQQFTRVGLYRKPASVTSVLYFDNWARARWWSDIANNF